jgi:hypothetical protein
MIPMACPEIPILAASIVGASAGFVFYGIAAHRKGAFSGLILAEAMFQGFLLATAVHLMFCIYCPAQLIEVFDQDEKIVHLDRFTVRMDNLHGLELFVASVMFLVVSVRAMWTVWKHPGH